MAKKRKRTHLPALSTPRLDALRKALKASTVPPVAQDAVMQSLRAAQNKKAETPEAVIASLQDAQERQSVRIAQQGYMQTLSSVGARGRSSLMMDNELDSLIAEQGDE